jgi:hypothetical protein
MLQPSSKKQCFSFSINHQRPANYARGKEGRGRETAARAATFIPSLPASTCGVHSPNMSLFSRPYHRAPFLGPQHSHQRPLGQWAWHGTPRQEHVTRRNPSRFDGKSRETSGEEPLTTHLIYDGEMTINCHITYIQFSNTRFCWVFLITQHACLAKKLQH